MPLVPASVAVPPGLGSDPVGGNDADPGDHRAAARIGKHRVAQADTSRTSGGSDRIIADWKPPKPLAVESAVATGLRTATFGV